LSRNDWEIYDVVEMLKLIDGNSQFGSKRHHFALRMVSFTDCPNIWPMEFKVKAKLDEFYQKRRKLLISYKSIEYLKSKLDAIKKTENELAKDTEET
jgi:hypothetical protein